MMYKILRASTGMEPGAVVDESAFLSTMRIRQLVSQGLIEPMPEEDEDTDRSPGVPYTDLLELSVRALRERLPEVDDIQTIKKAYSAERRKVARSLYVRRMEDISYAQQTK